MTDIFISYKKEDVARVESIARALANAGYDVWWDHRIPPGRSYRDVIGAALQSAKCVIVVWSDKSANAQWVLDEADEGKKRNVLLPLLIDDVEIPYGFRQIEAARLVGWSGDPTHEEWKSALEAVAHFVGRAPGGAPKPFRTPSAAAPAPTPQREAVIDSGKKKSGAVGPLVGLVAVLAIAAGGYFAWQSGVFGGGAQIAVGEDAPAAAATPAAPQTAAPLRVLHVGDAEAREFRRLADGGWLQVGADGAPRFRFAEISADASGIVLVDDTRGVQLRISADGGAIEALNNGAWAHAFTVTSAERGEIAAPRGAVTGVWFDGGGAFVREGEVWAELARETGLPGSGRWTEQERSVTTILLRDAGRDAQARIELQEGWIYLYFPDWGEFRRQWRIRAVDRDA